MRGLVGFLTIAACCLASVLPSQAQTAQGLRIATEVTRQFHEEAGDVLIWDDQNYNALINAIQGLDRHGLDPEHYRLSRLLALRTDRRARDRVATSAWLMAATHLGYGKLDPVSVEPDWTAINRPSDFGAVLRYALSSRRIATSLEQFAPVQPGYSLLKAELARLKLAAMEPVSNVPEGPALKAGMTGDRVTALQNRLVQLQLLPSDAATGTFDETTLVAVETWQHRAGLDADGVVGAATVRTLNRGVEDQIAQVRVNMERWRWLPADLGLRHLRANIAAFEVTAYEAGLPVRTHLTIVGKTYRKTPVFSDEIEYIVFNPWWETPTSLARSDKLPMFKKDPDAVTRLGFQILNSAGAVLDPSTINWNDYSASNFPFRIRQAPGPDNALGQVKIMFPNVHNVYLHDTPTRGLFAQRQRAFSSGCIRTQDPISLSKWLLQETPEWDEARIDAAVASGKETRATLSARVPVHILYFTVISDGAGGVRYLDDIYQRDARVLNGLAEMPIVSEVN